MAEQTPKPGWAWISFGDVVRLNTDRIADPLTADIERFVGLEHIEPEDLRIRRWGSVAEGTTFTNRFRPGQVLFGKRRAYQRKVALADFEGVCSSDIYVFESKDPNVLLPELLPFLCQTEGFFQHAVGTSAGSLSPRTNWTHLAAYAFALPPLEEQRRIAEVLRAIEVVLETYQQAMISSASVIDANLEVSLSGLATGERRLHPHLGTVGGKWPVVPIGAVIQSTQYGLSTAPKTQGKYPILRMTNLVDGKIIDDDMAYVDLSQREYEQYRLYPGDVLFNRTNSYDLVGRTGTYLAEGMHVFASYLVRIRVNEQELQPEYLTAYLNAPLGRRQVLSFATKGVSQANVNASNLVKVLMPIPSVEEQKELIQQTQTLRNSSQALQARARHTGQLKKHILNDMIWRDP